MPSDDKNCIRTRGDLSAHPQIAKHHFDRDVATDGQRIRIHQAAGAVLVITQDGFQPNPVALVERLQHFPVDRFGQLGKQIRQVVQFQIGCGSDKLLGVHLLDQRRADFFVERDEDLPCVFPVDQFPDDIALCRR